LVVLVVAGVAAATGAAAGAAGAATSGAAVFFTFLVVVFIVLGAEVLELDIFRKYLYLLMTALAGANFLAVRSIWVLIPRHPNFFF
jgi:hypothetical protein